MSVRDQLDPVSVLPNRLGLANFSPRETEAVLGADRKLWDLSAQNFNWLAAYLCQEVGLYEEEVPEWFRSRARGLGDHSPLRVWPAKDGFAKVFEYAQVYKAQVDEDLADEPAPDDLTCSFNIAERALEMIFKSFEAAGVDPQTDSEAGRECVAVYNLDSPKVSARWKRAGDLEDYRVTLKDGLRESTYFIVRYLAGPESQILQSGIGRHFDSSDRECGLDLDTDLDGRPPGVNEVASFVVALASEAKNRSLSVWAHC